MFDINLEQIKKNLLKNILKVVEFSFDTAMMQDNEHITMMQDNELIKFEKGILKLNTFLVQN